MTREDPYATLRALIERIRRTAADMSKSASTSQPNVQESEAAVARAEVQLQQTRIRGGGPSRSRSAATLDALTEAEALPLIAARDDHAPIAASSYAPGDGCLDDQRG